MLESPGWEAKEAHAVSCGHAAGRLAPSLLILLPQAPSLEQTRQVSSTRQATPVRTRGHSGDQGKQEDGARPAGRGLAWPCGTLAPAPAASPSSCSCSLPAPSCSAQEGRGKSLYALRVSQPLAPLDMHKRELRLWMLFICVTHYLTGNRVATPPRSMCMRCGPHALT